MPRGPLNSDPISAALGIDDEIVFSVRDANTHVVLSSRADIGYSSVLVEM